AGDGEKIARSATALRRISLVLGLLGGLMLAALAFTVSKFTFGDYQHAGGVVLLSLAVLFRLVSAGQAALIQGLRGIANLA
ncbi:O-antigen translocase, partial [Rhizobium ruizarguesonis]